MKKVAQEAKAAGILNGKSIKGMPEYGQSSNFHSIHLLIAIVAFLIAIGVWGFIIN